MVCETRSADRRRCTQARLNRIKRHCLVESCGDNFSIVERKMASRGKEMEVDSDFDLSLWPTSHEKVFVDLMEAAVDLTPLKSSTFDGRTRAKFRVDLQAITHRNYSMKQIHDKYNRLRQQWRAFRDVKMQSGLGWDEDTGTVTCEPVVWDAYVKAHPKARGFNEKGLANFDALTKIFKNSIAQGTLARASTQMPLTSDEARRVDEEFAQHDVPYVLSDDEGDGAPGGQGSRKRRSAHSSGRATKSTKTSGKDDAVSSIAAAARSKQRYYDNLSRGESQPQPTQPQPQAPPPTANDPYSMTETMKILNSMTGFHPQQMVKAYHFFVNNPEAREGFIGMSEEYRRWFIDSFND